VLNVNSYIDTLDEIYIRLDFARAILKLEVKESLVYIKDYLKTIYLAIFKYLVNKELFCETTNTSS
jgi:hypothetical protein